MFGVLLAFSRAAQMFLLVAGASIVAALLSMIEA
jgi:hypothetical protein